MKSKTRAMGLTVCLGLLLAVPASAQFGMGGSPNKIAHFHLTGPVLEKPVDPMATLFGSTKMSSLKDLLERFKKARDDDSVKAVVLTIENASMGVGQLEEIRAVLQQIRAADKDVFITCDEMNTGLYALATAASHINVVPTGDIWLTGLYGEQPYLKGLLDKLEITADMEHVGDYKSASEMFTRTGPSEEADANANWLFDGIYESIVGMIAETRQISEDKVRALIDDGPYSAERALQAGLIDSVKYPDEFEDDLKQRFSSAKIVSNYGKGGGPEMPTDIFGAFSFFTDLIQGKSSQDNAPSVGIVYVDGAISLGSEEVSPFGGSSGAKSTSIRKALNKAAEDSSVKAVVLRVDSPGGSAVASEMIWNATQRVAAKKPLIVSMGNVAGSGGYYVSCGADTIFADSTTITGSIGVVGGKLVTTGFWNNKLGINWKEYQRGDSADLLSSAETFSESEREKIKRWMNEVYVVFKDRVTSGRGDKLTKPLDDIAGGRVYTGKQALDLGLVDRLGGLDDAVKFAAAKANMSEYEIRVIPRTKNIFELLMEDISGGEEESDISLSLARPAAASLFAADSPLLGQIMPVIQRMDPARAKAIMGALQRLDMINQEGVITMMPWDLVPR
jgi:protease-4